VYFVQYGCLTSYFCDRKLSVSLCVFVRRFIGAILSNDCFCTGKVL
jgi:hypothetical protein